MKDILCLVRRLFDDKEASVLVNFTTPEYMGKAAILIFDK
jgi:hypothetical protein